jgi:hypothetical protein
MSDRYFAKIVMIQDKYTVVINAGSEKNVKVGAKFLIVGLGEIIIDPDTNEELERLEIVRGRAQVAHVQEKIATLSSSEYERESDFKEIKKVTARGGFASFTGPQDTVTETTKPGEEHLKAFRNVQVGDLIIAL